MQRLMRKLAPLAIGGSPLGVWLAMQNLDFNGILFQFLATWLSVLASLLFGGDFASFSNPLTTPLG